MKTNIFRYLIILILAGGFFSCQDYLEETNPNLTDSDSFWKNLKQTNSTLNATYSTLMSHWILNVREEAWRSDMAVPGFGRPSYSGDGVVWFNQLYTNSNQYIRDKWESLYLGIYRANQTIQGLEGIEGQVDEADWTTQMAQARFLRGLFHFYLHSSFNKGNVIIRDKVPASLDEYNKGISPAAEVLEFFRSDLAYAYEHLPASYEDAADKGRVTKGTAATILGTSYLYENQIDSAIYYFDDVINNRNAEYGYELVTDMNLIFTEAGELNKESIFEIIYSSDLKQELNTWVEDRFTNRLAAYSTQFTNQSFFPSYWITWAYMSEPMDTKDSRNYYVNKLGATVLRNVSLRASSMVALAVDEITPYYGKKAWEVGSFNVRNGASRYKKYTNHDILTNEDDNPGGKFRSGRNVVVNRLADVYLMLAECYIYKGELDQAIGLINTVRGRWGLQRIGLSNGDTSHDYDEVAYDATTLLTRLQDVEKPLETSVEGHCTRWNDLRRWGILKENFVKHSQEKFWSADFKTEDGVWKYNVSITNVDPNNANRTLFVDYDQAALNFNYDSHAWLPIPSNEESSNQGLSN